VSLRKYIISQLPFVVIILLALFGTFRVWEGRASSGTEQAIEADQLLLPYP